jgi:hypothetical protein
VSTFFENRHTQGFGLQLEGFAIQEFHGLLIQAAAKPPSIWSEAQLRRDFPGQSVSA